MYFLPSLISFFLTSYVFHVAAAPFTKRDNGWCHQPVPKLEVESLNVDRNLNFEPGFSTFAYDAESGGTSAYHASSDISQSYSMSNWNASDANANVELFQTEESLAFKQYHIINSSIHPWRIIGRLFFKRFKGDKGGWCSGALVGRRLVLTASHCFPWGYGGKRWMRFVPGYGHKRSVEPYGGSYVSRCRGVKNTFNVTGIDYVICALCEPLGDLVGWMGTMWWKDEEEYLKRSWFSSGYPINVQHGQRQVLIDNLTLDNVDPHGEIGVELESQVFASSGWSGGPLWGYVDGQPKVVGVCSGGERDCSEKPGGCFTANGPEPFHDVSAGGKLMIELVRHAKTQWDT